MRKGEPGTPSTACCWWQEPTWSETWKIPAGLERQHPIPGHDVSGEIVEVGPGVTGVTVGEAVYALTASWRDGATDVAPKPRTLGHIQAARVPQVGLTAWQALFEYAGLTSGQSLLIHGAAGGVGSMAVQMAKWAGARVIATASARHHAFLRTLGADEIIDYTTTRFEEVACDVDLVLDPIGGEAGARSWQVVKKGGLLLSVFSPSSQEQAATFGVRAFFFVVKPDREQLIHIGNLIDTGQLRPITERVVLLSEASQAFEQALQGHTRGKIILRVEDEEGRRLPMILVTGATSAVGKAVINELLARKVSVRAFVHQPVDAAKLQAQGVEAFVGDMTKQASVAQALRGIESIYLITPVAEHLFETEELWAREGKKAGLRHLVKQSEIGADPRSVSPLLRSHGKAEDAICASGIPYTLLRTLYLMQNFELMDAPSILTQEMIYAPLADARLSYVDARDIGAVAAHLLGEEKHLDKEYEVTGPEAITCTHLAEIFSSVLHTPIHYATISDEETEKALPGRYPLWGAHVVVTLLQFYRQGGGNLVTPVVDEVTGRKPCTAAAFISEHRQRFQAA